MRTTIDLPDELVRRAKSIAAKKGLSLKTLFTRALQKETSSLEGIGDASPQHVQFPLIKSKAPLSQTISNATIEDCLSQDDFK
ncbi:type II toxin-antitoxin system VapB family antitoxin [Puniceicoccaceae bacterium K14]|nr:type II toxin-antitoxin system VapB family antitoxin [Puniceicoccaceae bacterium K14]